MLEIAMAALGITYYTLALLAGAREGGPESIHDSKNKLLRAALILFYVVTGYYVGGQIYASRSLRITTLEPSQTGLLFSSFTPFHRTEHRLVTYVASPVGWQNTGISLRLGDRVLVTAAGRVNIAISEVISASQRRLAIESARDSQGLHPDMFTDHELSLITPRYDWTGPDGYGNYRGAYPGRDTTLAFRDAPFGALIGQIVPEGASPVRPIGRPFLIGKRLETTIDTSGNLWLNVNDVGYYSNKPADYASTWYRDNVGFFVVTLFITR